MKPIHYQLSFEPDFELFQFKGEEQLNFSLEKPTRMLELDAAELTVSQCFYVKGSKRTKLDFRVDLKNEKLLITFAQELKKGEHTIQILFEGIHNDHLSGFYRSKYTHKGKEKYLVTTQFEAADARRAFPCIDNPSHKATFDVTLIADKNLVALSNTLPVSEDIVSNGKRKTVFETTPKMSTYLLYLGVGEFEWIKDRTDKVKIRVITTPGKKEHGKFALDLAKKCLAFYEDYFGYPYPLPKLDLIAIPDFSSGAMENWGAITFRENALLFYEKESSVVTKQRVAEVVAHEIVHQWFGNLVTMKWWDDLWLNESFATYMAYKAIDRFFPEWTIWNEYISYALFGAMSLDSLKSTRSIKSHVTHVSQIDELFDEIAYEKGGSILRMLDCYLGYDVFEQGLKKYITTYAYGNAEATEFWKCLQEASRLPVVEIMKSYIVQKGFPEIHIEKTKRGVRISQKRFLFSGRDTKTKWHVPVMLGLGTERKEVLLSEKKKDISLSPAYAFVNGNQSYEGFYITSYGNDLLQMLGKEREKLAVPDSLGLFHDVFSLVFAMKQDLHKTVHFIKHYFEEEDDVESLHYLIGKLWGITLLLNDIEIRKMVRIFAERGIYITGLQPKKNEAIHITHLRSQCISILSYLNDKAIQSFVLKQFAMYLKNKTSVHPDLVATVLNGAVWIDTKNYAKIQQMYENELVYETKVKLLMSLGNPSDMKLLKRTLEYGLTGKVRLADLLYVVVGAARNPKVKDEVFNWFVKNWASIKGQTGGHSTTLLRRLMKVIIPVGAVEKEKQAKEFVRKNINRSLEKTASQVLEELEINNRFVKKYKIRR